MKKFLIFFLYVLLFNSTIFSQTRDLDSVYKVKINPFWTFLLDHEQLDCKIFTELGNSYIPTDKTIFIYNSQEIIKKGKTIYIQIAQTGIIYSLKKIEDSLLVFKRMDNTVNVNYNIDANNFLYKNEIYSFGGYGFWKNNGHLRKFNKVDREWDIIPLNTEIKSNKFSWLSEKEAKLYIPYERQMNAGIASDVQITRGNKSYYLDLDKKQWVTLGLITKEFIEITSDQNIEVILNTEKGFLYLQRDQAYLIDLIHNKLYKSHNSDLNQFLIRRTATINIFVYQGNIYSYEPISQKFLTMKYDMSDFNLLPYPIWTSDKHIWWYVLGGLLFVILIGSALFLIRRNSRNKLQKAQLKMLKTKSIQQAFVGTELTLIKLLLNANAQQQKIEIHQLNHVLGIKDKNVGLQKKVRSDVMNAINDKYQFITQSDIPLISSVRKEDDKRFFEYFITISEIKKIQRIIQE